MEKKIATTLDHFLLGINDLEKGINEFEKLTGVRPEYGGVHPQIGTHNALVSLGPGTYLEIIAPQDSSKEPKWPFNGFENMDSLTLFGWCIGTTELENIKSFLDSQNIQNSGIVPGSRQTGTGEILSWETVFIDPKEGMGVNPFFISWDEKATHPSLSTPGNCVVKSIKVCCEETDWFRHFLDLLSVDITKTNCVNNKSGKLVYLEVECSKGIISFNL